MNKEKEQKIFEVYERKAEYSDVLQKDYNAMLIELWEIWDGLNDKYEYQKEDVEIMERLESFLSSIHPESLPFDEILRRVEG